MLDILVAQLGRVSAAIPPKALRELRKVPVWINPVYDGHKPSAEYHPERRWLEDNGRDPAMTKAVEITNVSVFPAENRRMPYLLLHELAHAYHDRVIGFDDPELLAAYQGAKRSGTYDAVERFNGRTTTIAKAYAMADHKEYFAETSEAMFGRNDYYPFTRGELEKHDPAMLGLLRQKWGLRHQR